MNEQRALGRDQRAADREDQGADLWDEVFAGKPDLIASGKSERATVLFKMSRRHADVLGAYLNGRNDISQGALPEPLKELLDALTLRLVAPSGHNWASLKQVLDGQGPIAPVPPETWQQMKARTSPIGAPEARHRKYDGGPNGEDLRVQAGQEPGRYDHLRQATQALLGDADGTPVSDWFEAKPETD